MNVNGPFGTNGHMVQNPLCWMVSYVLENLKQRKVKPDWLKSKQKFTLEAVAFFCHSAWQKLYHVIVVAGDP